MITLVLAFHNHQPIGNFDWVVEDAYRKAYRPLLDLMERYPAIRFAQHYTGILLDWFDRNHPDFLDVIDRGVSEGRIELVSGGYYEPILAMLPERDRVAQIEKLNARIAGEFGVTPTGMWLAERVWEPALPSTLADAGIRYTFLDDTHFKHAGLTESDLTGWFLTEDQGKPLAVFPIDKRLRYTMPFEAPEKTFEYLHSLNRRGQDRLVTFADDGEKFGIWPDTWRTVYEEGWLRRFCELLTANAGWVRTVLPGELVGQRPPAGRIYLPTASYAEMLHWALPTARAFMQYEAFEEYLKDQGVIDEYNQYVRGGFWRNFLVKYPEANAMQKKMLRISGRIDRLRRAGTVDAATLDRAHDHLMAGQCNCPYWHGVFGGLYLSNIRSAIYRELIRAEHVLDPAEGITAGRVSVTDYNLDGHDEVLYESPAINLYIHPARGGGIFEFDYKPVDYNLTDLLNRRKEGYHADLTKFAQERRSAEAASDTGAQSIHEILKVKEEGLEKLLTYDTYRHGLLIDHFYATGISADALRHGKIVDLGDFAGGRYDFTSERPETGGTALILTRAGSIDGQQRVTVSKRIVVADDSADLDVEYTLRALDGGTLHGRFGIEMSYTLSAGNEPDRYYEINGRRPPEMGGKLAGAGAGIGDRFALVDEWLGVRISVELGRRGYIVRAPLETVSLSEAGFERNYQGSIVVVIWELESSGEWTMSLKQRVERLG